MFIKYYSLIPWLKCFSSQDSQGEYHTEGFDNSKIFYKSICILMSDRLVMSSQFLFALTYVSTLLVVILFKWHEHSTVPFHIPVHKSIPLIRDTQAYISNKAFDIKLYVYDFFRDFWYNTLVIVQAITVNSFEVWLQCNINKINTLTRETTRKRTKPKLLP